MRACVIVPVRNEAASIGAVIDALANQHGVDQADYEIIVLANNCDDDSAALAHAAVQRHPGLRLDVIEQTFPPEQANIGHARRALMDEAARRLGPDGVITSTDGDTIVDSHWLAATLREIAAGADLVGGRILARWPDDGSIDSATRRCHLNDTAYRFLMAEVEDLIDPDPADPWPRHFQHFGASLAITTRAYRAVGGLPRVDCLEDMALYEELRRIDERIRHSLAVRVSSAARPGGRVRMGFSTQLAEWRDLKRDGGTRYVESAGFLIDQYRFSRKLREAWARSLPRDRRPPFGAWREEQMRDFQSTTCRLEPIGAAIDGLRSARERLRALGRPAVISAPFEEVEAIRLGAIAGQMTQRSAGLSVG
jgi:glycosyltransferase involved in cell wall biosynthesis